MVKTCPNSFPFVVLLKSLAGTGMLSKDLVIHPLPAATWLSLQLAPLSNCRQYNAPVGGAEGYKSALLKAISPRTRKDMMYQALIDRPPSSDADECATKISESEDTLLVLALEHRARIKESTRVAGLDGFNRVPSAEIVLRINSPFVKPGPSEIPTGPVLKSARVTCSEAPDAS